MFLANYDVFLFDGHGDGDSGAVGNGRQEHNEAKRLNNKIYEYLKPTGLRIHRGVNNYQNNLLAGNTYNYKFGFSTHLNSAGAGATGIEMIVQPEEKYLNVEEAILKKISALTGLQNRGMKSRDYNTGAFIKRTNGTSIGNKDYYKETRDARNRGLCLSIIETCFISNPSDMAKFDKYFNDIAFIIADEIAKYCGKTINKPTPPQDNSSSKVDTYFRVIVGSYKDRQNAEAQQAKLKKAGFDSFLEAFKK